ncbi:MAG: hypothetical protein K2W96_26325 [Gemmataceae bacterium]|nr:hypothetical protein [Gemmataceae bacterium]
MHHPRLEDLVRRRQAYPIEAYEFVREALGSAGTGDPGPRQLLEAACELARREFGAMALAVFRAWGVRRTDDFGEIVSHLAEARLLESVSDADLAAFREAFPLEPALGAGVVIEFPPEDA